jgi:hypothetical protein
MPSPPIRACSAARAAKAARSATTDDRARNIVDLPSLEEDTSEGALPFHRFAI